VKERGEHTYRGPDEVLIAPIERWGKGFKTLVVVLGAVVLWAVYAFIYQYRNGLGVTGLNRPVFWGIYITNFVFFIGISHAGTLISAILRIAHAEWRRAITRSAEVITVLVLFFGVANIVIDMGRPDRLLNIPLHGRLESPLLWDVLSVSTYLLASTIYLYLPLIPDIAILRDTVKKRQWLYRTLALGWKGTPRQERLLGIGIAIGAIVVIPIAVSVHTVVSFVFAMTIQPMWHSAIFGPYFVAGAIFSGIAALIIAMAVIRRAYHLEDYLKPIHFNHLGVLLLIMTLLWLYFTASEFITTYYGAEPSHMKVFYEKFTGEYAPHFWSMVVFCFVVPFAILSNRRLRTVKGTVIASGSVIVGMWLERYVIIVPSLINPRLPYARGSYDPNWVEFSIFAGSLAMFILLYAFFTRLFPIVSIWEIREGRTKGMEEIGDRVREYIPGEGRFGEKEAERGEAT
jgi:molybdopterin-containing oxidoreductase family membrane subunit